MKIAFLLFEDMTALDFVSVFDPLTRLKTMGIRQDVDWDICALQPEITDHAGLIFRPTRVKQPLSGYDLLVIPGGYGTRRILSDPDQRSHFVDWLSGAQDCPVIASVCTGSLLLGAAGYLKDKRATTHPSAFKELEPFCAAVLADRIVDEGRIITAGGVTAGLDLGLYLVEKLAGAAGRQRIQTQMDYVPGLSDLGQTVSDAPARQAKVTRSTAETKIEIDLNLDGRGQHTIETGIGFLDHMLTHLAVHGLFDLQIFASGDLQVDVHHTVEDVALSLGQAFSQALGDRKGIVRMASAYTPMDEALAFVALDFSGRPYARVEARWNSPYVGNIPTSLFAHFLESFASTAGCNVHARLLDGRDDHHQAEALFKALARALDAATQIDSRRSDRVPSTKGTLTV